MQTPEGPNRSGNEILHVLRLSHVGLHEDSLALFAFDCLDRLPTSGINVTDYNLRAVARKQKRCGLADPAAPASNERDLAGKIEGNWRHRSEFQARVEAEPVTLDGLADIEVMDPTRVKIEVALT